MSNEVVDKPKIEAIYPLNTMQQGVLFHHLTSKEDQGFLNVQCSIDGDLDIDLFKKSWDSTIERHAILRTSVHWKKIKSPVQIVKPEGVMQWEILDWTSDSEKIQQTKLSELKHKNRIDGIDFQKNPLSNISLIKTEKSSHYLVWSCHHLLLDGWSTSIILKDVFSFYDALVTNKKSEFETIPAYKSYLNYIKQISVSDAKKFWNNTFNNFETPFLFNASQSKIESLTKNHVQLPEAQLQKVKDLTKFFQITPNTLFQGIWALIISKYSDSKDISYGNTVSGRSGDFPNIELIAGMFANVLPIRTKIDADLNTKNWFKSIQNQQIEARKYEHYSISEITEIIQSDAPSLFDSLFIFENYPWEDITAGNVKVHSSESGITTTYPLTVIIKAEKEIDIHLMSDASIFSEDTNQWILNRFEEIVTILFEHKNATVDVLLEKITSISIDFSSNESTKTNIDYIPQAPKNKTELELLKIWEELLNKNNIGTQDHFFEIGGKSLLAIKMFTLIEKKLKVKISPITLLEHPTIESLSKFIIEDKPSSSWDYVVPIQAKGTKTPLFCIHGGGGYVFFFNPIANALDTDRPVYAIQPSGISSAKKMHQSIQEMAKDYAKEIMDIQPKGPYNLLVYCFSPAVGIEIADAFKNLGEQTNLIVIDSIIKQEDFTDPDRIKMRVSGFIKRFVSNPFKAIKLMSLNNYHKFIEPRLIQLFGSETKKNLEQTKQNLVQIYKAYEWNKKHPGKSTLILTKKPDEKLNPTYIKAWESITDNNFNILYTEGHHHQLFQSPYADILATKIEKAII